MPDTPIPDTPMHDTHPPPRSTVPAATQAAPQIPPPKASLAARVLNRARWEAVAAGERLAAASRAARARAKAAGLARFAALAAARPQRMLGPVRFARRLHPSGRFLAETEALLVARGQGWGAAAPHFARLAAPGAPLSGNPAWAVIAPGAGVIPETGCLALPAAARPATLPAETAAGIVVYTAVFGRPPALAPVFELGDRLRFLCFTDHLDAAEIPGWTLLPPAPGSPDPRTDPEGARAFHKIRPEAALAEAAPGAQGSLWLDPDRWLVGNPDTLFGRWLLPAELALWRSPDGDWRAMAEHHLLRGAVAAEAVLAQAEALAAAGVPGGRGGYDTGMVWRRHGSPRAAAFAEGWWQAWQAAPGADDLALCRALAEAGGAEAGGDAGAGAVLPRPAILPARLGTATDNAFAARTVAGRRRRPPAAPPSGRPMPLVFLSAASHARSASTLLRGHQLSAMVAAAFPDRYAVDFTEDADAVRDAVVVLTKGAMMTLPPEAIARVAQRNVAVIGAWDDMRPEPEKVRLVDAHLTLSHRQTIDFNRMFPETPAFHVTHHVNRLVGAVTPPADRLRTGYFGDLENTVRPPSLAGAVALVGINTLDVGGSEGWIAALPDYNCHWIVRRARPWDGWKPFLKGFVAARCGAAVITTADDGDAPYYLGDDWPFYARSLAAADLEMALVEAAAAFGGPEWRRAEEIMKGVAARATDARVLAEFDAMVRSVAG